MKTSQFYLALILSLLFCCCSDEPISHENSPTVSIPFSFIGLRANSESRSVVLESAREWASVPIDLMDTRTTIDTTGVLGWVKNDEIAVFVKSDENAVSTSQALFTAGKPSAPENKTVTFNGLLSGLGTINTLYAVYPYDNGIKNIDQVATAYKLSYIGLQLGGGTVSHLGEYAHMVATPTVHKSSGNLSELSTLNFFHLNTMMEFKFTLPLTSSPITRVRMSTSGKAPLSGDVLIDMTAASTDEAFKKLTLADGAASNEIILNDIINKGADGYTAYGMILPGDHSNSSITFDVLTSEIDGSNKLYSATKPGTNFAQGVRYYFNDILSLEDKTTTIYSSSSKDFICGEMMKDERDDRIYKTVKIGEQCWMAENLNVGEFDDTENEVSVDFWNFDEVGIQKWCYGNLKENCIKYGGLYEWWEVMSGGYTTKISSENAVNTTLTESLDSLDDKYGVVLNNAETDVRGICPEGWHIPTLNEWKALGSVKSGWNTIVGSYRVGNGGSMSNLGNSSRWWSSSAHQTSNASYNSFSNTRIGTPTDTYRVSRSSGYSVRCIQDKYIAEPVPAVGYQVVAEPFYDYRELSDELKTMNYHRYENPTGLYFQNGDTVTIDVAIDPNIAVGEIFNFTIIDYGNHMVEPVEQREITQVYQLQQGQNTIIVSHEGLGYLPYYVKSRNYANLPKVECTFTGGHINGVFDPIGKGHTNEDWKRLLQDAIFEVIDIRGEYVSLVFPVEFLKSKAQDGVGIIDMFDDIIFWEQELMGLDQYGYRTNNRMFGRISWDGPPSAGGKGINFPNINGFESPDAIRNDCWGIGHEFGHQNQVRPGLKWHGTTEVTTNIYSTWIQYKLKPNGPLRLEHSSAEDGTGNKSIGGI